MLPPAQIEVLLALTITAGVTLVIVIVTGALVTVAVVTQFALLVICTVTTSLFASVDDEKVTAVSPATGLPLMNHWYAGASPSLVGLAVKVILPPAQIEVLLALTVTAGVTWVIVIVTGALVAVGVVIQFALLVITTVTTSLLASVDDEKVAFVAPATGLPLMNHWYVGADPPSVAVVVKVTVVPWHTGF